MPGASISTPTSDEWICALNAMVSRIEETERRLLRIVALAHAVEVRIPPASMPEEG